MSEDIFKAADSIAAGMPDATEQISNGHISEGDIPTYKDRKGRMFDSSIHLVGPDGKPLLHPDGSLKTKRGRRSGSANTTFRAAAEPPSEIQSKATGAAIAESIFLVCRSVGGEDFIPIVRNGIDERAMMIDAWQTYCEAKGITEIPPSMFICVAMLNYVAPRMSSPTVRGRIASGWQRMKNWYRRKRNPNYVPPEAATETGN